MTVRIGRRIFGAVNWRYALGEFLLIFVGILAALATAAWDEGRRERAEERRVLEQMAASLDSDAAAVAATLERLESSAARAAELIGVLERREPYTPALDRLFGGVYGVMDTQVNHGPYEDLKSRGLDLVSDDGVRSAIIDLYDRVYGRLAVSNEAHYEINSLVTRPFFLQNFENLRFNEASTPLDYDALLDDAYFRNMVRFRQSSLEGNSIEVHRRALDASTALAARIREYLADQEVTDSSLSG